MRSLFKNQITYRKFKWKKRDFLDIVTKRLTVFKTQNNKLKQESSIFFLIFLLYNTFFHCYYFIYFLLCFSLRTCWTLRNPINWKRKLKKNLNRVALEIYVIEYVCCLLLLLNRVHVLKKKELMYKSITFTESYILELRILMVFIYIVNSLFILKQGAKINNKYIEILTLIENILLLILVWYLANHK